jgi:hypothetical protein
MGEGEGESEVERSAVRRKEGGQKGGASCSAWLLKLIRRSGFGTFVLVCLGPSTESGVVQLVQQGQIRAVKYQTHLASI